VRPCQKDLCLLYSLGADYAKLIDFTNQNFQGKLFRAGARAMIYARRLMASWYGYDTGVLIETALRRILRRSITYCNIMRRLGLESEYCRRYIIYDAVPCDLVSVFTVDVAYGDIIHMIANYNSENVSKVLTKMTEMCSTYEVR
jgi:hypothetical protein